MDLLQPFLDIRNTSEKLTSIHEVKEWLRFAKEFLIQFIAIRDTNVDAINYNKFLWSVNIESKTFEWLLLSVYIA